MTITTPLHGDHQLDQLAAQFAHWRQTRAHPSERIPHALWDQAVALAATLPPSRVAKQVRVRLADLKKQMAARQQATAAGAPLPLSFIEVPPVPSCAPPTGPPQIALSRADGTRLCIRTLLAPLLLDARGRACGAGRACCNCPRNAGSCSPRNPWSAAKASMDWPPRAGRTVRQGVDGRQIRRRCWPCIASRFASWRRAGRRSLPSSCIPSQFPPGSKTGGGAGTSRITSFPDTLSE